MPVSVAVLVSATSVVPAEKVALAVASFAVSSSADGVDVVVGETAADAVPVALLEGVGAGVFAAVVGSAVVLVVGLGVAAVGELVAEGLALLVVVLLEGVLLGSTSDVSLLAAGLPPSAQAEVTASSVPHTSARDVKGRLVNWARRAIGRIQPR